jgi:hypothetical protein
MTALIEIEPGWVCCHCAKPVELIHPGEWWRHASDTDWMDDEHPGCQFRLMDDAYNEIEDRYYQSEDEEPDES